MSAFSASGSEGAANVAVQLSNDGDVDGSDGDDNDSDDGCEDVDAAGDGDLAIVGMGCRFPGDVNDLPTMKSMMEKNLYAR